ncbi:MAG: hypothetical protein HY247_01935 [archaeon]|nr:MAG: hypothetical protein HY247_01935 [archaeon]
MRGIASALVLGLLVLFPVPSSHSVKAQDPARLPAQGCADYPGNPLLDHSEPFTAVAFNNSTYTDYATKYEYPSVIRQGGAYIMWFSGAIHNVTGIFTASSQNGITWDVRPTPVLSLGLNGTWDDSAVYSPYVLWNGTMYLLYYTGSGTDSFRQVGLAYSPDNAHWTRYPSNPVLTAGPGYYDSWWTRFSDVILDNGIFRMWYTGHPVVNSSSWFLSVDYAESADGIHWNKYSGNPVLGDSQSFWNGTSYFSHPSVVKMGGSYIMVLDDYTQISYATSHDGISWTASKSVLVSPAGSPTWVNGSTLGASALVNGSSLLIWYWGRGFSSGNETSGIALAKCSLVVVSTTSKSTETTTATTTKLVTVERTQVTTRTFLKTGFGSLDSPEGAILGVSLVSAGLLLGLGLMTALARRRPKA